MKKVFGFSLPAIFLLNYLFSSADRPLPTSLSPLVITIDSGWIVHNFDGSTTEWPDNKFENDKETNISYAVDNDGSSLFVAMRIPDFPEQMKIMRMGMRFFIDLKAKKKDNMGIEFPLKPDFSSGGGGFNSGSRPADDEKGNEEKGKFDPKAMRESMMINLIFLKTFGFENQDEPHNQGLMMNGSANIAFSWDTADMMHIEYRVPLIMMGEKKSLQDKEISIGWKINGRDNSAAAPTGVTPPGGFGSGRRTSGRSFGSRSTMGNNNTSSQENFEKMMKEQSLWTKYTFTFPVESKGF